MKLLKIVQNFLELNRNLKSQTQKSNVNADTQLTTEEPEKFFPKKMNLNGYKCLSGGYQSWSEFRVSGVNEKGKKTSAIYKVSTESIALSMAKNDGIVAAYVSEIIPHDKPTEKQIAYADDLNIQYPEDVCKRDISVLIDLALDYREHIPMPTEAFGLYALEHGKRFCLFDSEQAVLNCFASSDDTWTQARFYAYAQLCNSQKRRIENIHKSEFVNEINRFAELVINDESLVKSLKNSSTEDFLEPNKRTKIYKAYADFFNIN